VDLNIVIGCMLGSFAPVAIFRFGKMCHSYITTGDIGNSDHALFMTLMDYDCYTWRERFTHIIFETHPATILADALFMLLFTIIGAIIIIEAPFLIAGAVTVAIFVFTLRWLRSRFMLKEEFVERLKGEYDGD